MRAHTAARLCASRRADAPERATRHKVPQTRAKGVASDLHRIPMDDLKSLASALPKDDGPWTEAEKNAVLEVRKQLITEKGLSPKMVGEIELITITLNAKLRVDEAVQKFMTYHESLLGEYGIPDVWADSAELEGQWHRLAVAGTDEGNRGIMWIHGGGTAVEEEAKCVLLRTA